VPAHLLERCPGTTPWKFLGTNGDHGEYYGPDAFPHITRFLDYHLRGVVPAALTKRTVTDTTTTTTTTAKPNGKAPVKRARRRGRPAVRRASRRRWRPTSPSRA
jgi:hypothetical protein